MKKYLLLVIVFIIPISFFLNKSTYDFYEIFKNYNSSTFCYVFNTGDENYIRNELYTSKINLKCLKNGSKEFVYFSDCNLLETIQNNTNLHPVKNKLEYMQVQVKLTKEDVKNIIKQLNAKVIFKEDYSDNSILYCYTKVWKNYKTINNLKINLQIVFNENLSTIGNPMVYGSF